MFAAHPVLGAGFGEFALNVFEPGADPPGAQLAMAAHAHALFELLAETGCLNAVRGQPLLLWLRAFRWSDQT